MAITDLNTYLGRAYHAKVMKQGDLAAIKREFVEAMAEDAALAQAAQEKLGQLKALEARMPPATLHLRAHISAVALEFLRDALA